MSSIVTATAKRWRHDRSFSFLSRPDQQDIFVHRDVVYGSGFDRPVEGAQITAEVKETTRGIEALRIIEIEGVESSFELSARAQIRPGCVRHFDWNCRHGVVRLFGSPGVDIDISPTSVRHWGIVPVGGQAVGVVLDPENSFMAARLIEWGAYHEA